MLFFLLSGGNLNAQSPKKKKLEGGTKTEEVVEPEKSTNTETVVKAGTVTKAEGDTTGVVPSLLKDTSILTYFYGMNPSQEYIYSDTLLEDLHLINPVRLQEFDYANLGNVGTASAPLFYKTKFRRGVYSGLEQYEIYKLSTDSLKFFNSLNGVSEVSFSSGNQQADGYFQGFFSRDFKNGINLALDAKRIFQQGESFHFQHQKSKQSAFIIGLSYVPESSLYSANFSYGNWVGDVEDNGGVLPDTIGVERPFEFNVNTLNGYTRNSC